MDLETALEQLTEEGRLRAIVLAVDRKLTDKEEHVQEAYHYGNRTFLPSLTYKDEVKVLCMGDSKSQVDYLLRIANESLFSYQDHLAEGNRELQEAYAFLRETFGPSSKAYKDFLKGQKSALLYEADL
ncbi:hypothetical protein D6825_02380 [Candidatus Woesearchaeota archaeon]|nr:MAG: hypothetical protein D6825_02380 [Candidatus Woesearchaeota archaeon]